MGLIRMTPTAARPITGTIFCAPPPAAGLRPACYIPSQGEIRAHGAALLIRRAVLTLAEIGCIGLFVASVWLWTAIAAGGSIHG